MPMHGVTHTLFFLSHFSTPSFSEVKALILICTSFALHSLVNK